MRRSLTLAALAVASLAGFAKADTFDFNMSNQSYLPSGGSSGWVTDRKDPASFGVNNNQLVTSVVGSDYQGEGANVFYNTQGMQHALTPISGNQSLSFDMLVDTTGWAGVANLRSGVWGVGHDGVTTDYAYPIISYLKGARAGVDGHGDGFYAYDYKVTGSWKFLASGISDTMNHLSMVLTVGQGFDYYVNNVKASYSTPDVLTQSINGVIVNSRNYEEGYTATFDNITSSAVPLPASVWGGAALMGLVLVSKRVARPRTA